MDLDFYDFDETSSGEIGKSLEETLRIEEEKGLFSTLEYLPVSSCHSKIESKHHAIFYRS
jgi:hypothetical protein